jgi:hypothetical protein
MSVYESELEFEEESELEYESEFEEEGEEFLGSIAGAVRGLLGEGEEEYEWEGELEGELEWEGELEGEEFFRRIGGFLRRAAPVLRNVARVAAPIVGTAVGGPLGGVLGRVASQALREEEFEYEAEFEAEYEGELEGELVAWAAQPPTPQQATAEFMAAVASQARTQAEAEAMVGAASVAAISPRDRATLRRVLPHIVRGTAVLTRMLRQRPVTRPAVRTVPTIVQRTARTLARRAQAGQPVTRRAAARVMAGQTRRVLGSPRVCGAALQRNARGAAAARRAAPARRPMTPAREY